MTPVEGVRASYPNVTFQESPRLPQAWTGSRRRPETHRSCSARGPTCVRTSNPSGLFVSYLTHGCTSLVGRVDMTG